MSYPVPPNEAERLAALRSYEVMDTEPELGFDRITAVTARLLSMPIVLVSLLDENRQWFKSNFGLAPVRETPRSLAFCNYCIQPDSPDVFVVQDTHNDSRFVNNSLVTGHPFIRFYAGAPLVVEDPSGNPVKIGTLCVIDTRPHDEYFPLHDKQVLVDMASMVVDALNLRISTAHEIVASKQEYIACTAHDLKTPLTCLRLSTDLLKTTELTPPQIDMLQQAEIAIEMMETTISKALAMARNWSTTGSDQVTPDKPVLIKSILERTKTMMEKYPKSVPVTYSVSDTCPEFILTDATTVWRSLVNLLSNSCKHTSTGTIHCEATSASIPICFDRPPLSPSCFSNSNDSSHHSVPTMIPGVRFEVRDTGLGVDPAIRGTLFLPFVQSDTQWQPSQASWIPQGTGLGLYSVKQGVTALNGRCGVESNPHTQGNGTVFWFEVPDMACYDPSKAITYTTTSSNINGHININATPTPRRYQMQRLNSFSRTAHTTTLSITENETKSKTHDSSSHPPSQSPNSPSTGTDTTSQQESKSHDPLDSTTRANFLTTQVPALSLNSGDVEELGAPEPSFVLRALVVDDSPMVRKIVVKALKQQRFTVVEASNGIEALEALKTFSGEGKPFQIVFMDFLMPVMDGVQCCAAFREWERTKYTGQSPMIWGISGNAESADIRRGLEVGMDGFLPKPLTAKSIKDVVEVATARIPGDAQTRRFTGGSHSDASTQRRASWAPPVATNANTAAVAPDPPPLETTIPVSSTTDSTDVVIPLTALLVEDSVSISTLITKALELQDIAVTTCDSGEAALEKMCQQRWGAVLIDQHIVGSGDFSNGLKVVSMFRTWETQSRSSSSSASNWETVNQTARQLIVCCSGASESNAAEVALSHGCDLFWPKPINLAQLKLIGSNIKSCQLQTQTTLS
eukprot:c13071_g2_i1.p1 GENE.c13071_g2_i1~~c13071_g2_i1.p1  ORF type:complete len:912 (-),score=178.76 c13071_g2_i1:666-3401(-)